MHRKPHRTAVLALLLLAALSVSLSGCRAEAPAAPTEAPAAIETAPAETPAPITETPAPADLTPPEAPPVHIQTGVREDGSFDAGTLFVGDSLTMGLVREYLIPNGLIGDAMYAAIGGHAMQQFFRREIHLNSKTLQKYGCVYSARFEKLSLAEAVAEAGGDVTTLYFMMGTNGSTKATVEVYTEMLTYLADSCPNAVIFMETVPYCSSGVSKYEFVNANLREAVENFTAEGHADVYILDTFTAIGEENNTHDGLHITENGQAAWYDALIANDAALNGE